MMAEVMDMETELSPPILLVLRLHSSWLVNTQLTALETEPRLGLLWLDATVQQGKGGAYPVPGPVHLFYCTI